MSTAFKPKDSWEKIRAGLARFGASGRILAFCVMASVVATLTTHFGWMNRLEIASSDIATFGVPKKASGETIIVAVDAETIKATGKYPYDRQLVAKALNVLREAGADRIFFDAASTIAENPESDQTLAEALAALGPDRIALPIGRIGAREIASPLPRFQQHVTLVSTDFVYDVDNRIRTISALEGHQPAGDWLARLKTPATAPPRALDYAVHPASFPKFGLRDIAAGKAPVEALKGKTVVIGLMLEGRQTGIDAPIHGILARTLALAISAESARASFERRPLDIASRFGVVFVFSAILGLLIAGLNSLFGFAVIAAASVGWVYAAGAFQPGLNHQLPIVTPVVAALFLWQGLSFSHSRFSVWMRHRYMSFAGVGQTALLTAIEVMGDPAFVFDSNGAVVGANAPFRALLDAKARAGATSVRVDDLLGDAFAAAVERANEEAVSLQRIQLRHSAHPRHYDVTMRMVSTMNGRFGIAGLKDVSEAVEREKTLSNLAFSDSLTGIANRIAFRRRLEGLGEGAGATRFAVLLIDLDGFKQVNDTLGHHAGDLLLRGVAVRLQTLMRESDLAARLGGDEFAVLLPGAGCEEASLLAKRFISALAAPFALDGGIGRVGASIGIAVWPDHGLTGDDVLRLADQAMYVAKRNKPAYAVHAPEGAELFKAA